MEAVEFIRTIQKMCTKRHCDECPLSENYRCNVCYTEDPEESVRIVEEWAKEQESEKSEQERQNPEQEKRLLEMEGQIRMLCEKTKMINEDIDIQTSKIYDLYKMIDKLRNAVPFVDRVRIGLCRSRATIGENRRTDEGDE